MSFVTNSIKKKKSLSDLVNIVCLLRLLMFPQRKEIACYYKDDGYYMHVFMKKCQI